jgi:5-deoxy-glucuronate isomerase
MSNIIRRRDNANQALVDASSPILPEVYFNLVKCVPGTPVRIEVANTEIVAVVLSGTCDIGVGAERFADVGQRRSIWDGKADSVYAGSGQPLVFEAKGGPVEIALAGAPARGDYKPFRIAPQEVESVVVGSSDTKSKREIFHILGQNANDRVGALLVSELYCEEGCWSGYPPHKHDEDRSGETNHAELYHYRYNPPTGFGAQLHYVTGEAPRAEMVMDGDTYLLPDGYHPTVASPGHSGYVFTILVGRTQRGLVQHFDTTHDHLVARIPGIAGMRAAFK